MEAVDFFFFFKKKIKTNSIVRIRPQIHKPMYFDKWLRQTYWACNGLHPYSSVVLQCRETRLRSPKIKPKNQANLAKE